MKEGFAPRRLFFLRVPWRLGGSLSFAVHETGTTQRDFKSLLLIIIRMTEGLDEPESASKAWKSESSVTTIRFSLRFI